MWKQNYVVVALTITTDDRHVIIVTAVMNAPACVRTLRQRMLVASALQAVEPDLSRDRAVVVAQIQTSSPSHLYGGPLRSYRRFIFHSTCARQPQI